jgi:nitrate reductase gamma subunit
MPSRRRVMLDYLQKAKLYLWVFVEIGFLTVLSVILIYLILGPDSSGVFVSGVADNVLKFAAAIPAQSLVGLAIVLALVMLIANRMR